nr:Ger(x)C family spore germination protein [Dehalobacterium formicoaceticum]
MFFLVFYGLAFLVFLPACWDSRELDELAIVLGVGVDREGDGLQLTAEIAKPGQMAGGKGGSSGSGGEPVFMTHGSGATVFDAARNARSHSSRALFFPNNEVVVLGNDLAKQGIYPALDFFLRDHEPRATAWVLVAEEKARDVFEAKDKLEDTNGLSLSSIIQQGSMSKIPGINVQEVNAAMLDITQAFLIPIVGVVEEGEDKHLKVDGNAGVFVKDKMVGEMNNRETRGVKWVKGEIKSTSVVSHLIDEAGTMSSEIFLNKSSIKAVLDDGDPKVKVEIIVEGNISDQSGTLDLSTEEGMIKANESTAQAIKKEVLQALGRAKSYNADVFGFGEVVGGVYPKEWQKMKSSWQEIFPHLDVAVEVRVNLWRTGDVLRTVLQ